MGWACGSGWVDIWNKWVSVGSWYGLICGWVDAPGS